MHRKTLALLGLGVAALMLAESAAAQWVWTPQTGRFVNLRQLPKETPELQLEHARSLMVAGNYRQALRETDKFMEFYPTSELADENQFLRGEIREAQGNYIDAASEYQQVAVNYPASELYDQVIARQYAIGDRLFERGQARLERRWRPFRHRPLRRAAEVYAMVIENQPFTDEAAQAQYKIGLVQYTRGNHLEAVYEYTRVVEDYPASDWVNDASYGLVQSHHAMSLPPDYDQSPSKLTIRAIDRFRDRFPGDERAADLPALRQEMRDNIAMQRMQTAAFYEKRRNFMAARIYYEVVAEEFADTPYAADAEAWLDANPGVRQPGPRAIADARPGQ